MRLQRVPASHVCDAFAAEQSRALSRIHARHSCRRWTGSKADNPRIHITAGFFMPQHSSALPLCFDY